MTPATGTVGGPTRRAARRAGSTRVCRTLVGLGFLVFLVALPAACSDGAEIEAGSADGRVLAAILEPADAEVARFGGGWESADRWFTEGAANGWSTGCADADALGDVFRDAPLTHRWLRGDDRLHQRVASLDWDAADHLDRVVRLPSTCPGLTVGSTTVALDEVDRDRLGLDAVDGVGWAVVALDAFPAADRGSDGETPAFTADRASWLVVAVRHNVVTHLVFSPSPDGGPGPDVAPAEALDEALDELGRLATILVDTLAAAPIEASGPFERPAGPPEVAFRELTDVELLVDREVCRNDGGFMIDGVDWRLTGPVPFEWADVDPILGAVTMEGTEASFTAAVDGRTVELTTGAVNSDCPTWEEPAPVEPLRAVGRLDCGPDGLVVESRVPDRGEAPADLAAEVADGVVEVEAGEPLQWWGLDGDGRVVVGVFLGDAEGADYQLVTCDGG